MKRITPTPQIIKPGEWEVREKSFGGSVDLEKRCMYVPFDTSEISTFIRAHEYAHTQWSKGTPRKLAAKWRATIDAVEACEDARINFKLKSIGVEMPQELLERAPMVTRVREQALATISIGPMWEKVASLYKFDAITIAKIKTILDLLPDVELASREFDKLFPPETKKTEGDEVEYARGKGNSEKGVPGRMRIVTMPMIRKFQERKKPYTEGFIFRYPHRVLTDKLCFTRKTHGGFKGTLLIDASGSMSWSMKRLLKLVQKIPFATIACYSGSGKEGTLYIVAKDGFVTTRLPKFNVGNIIDIPALEWLSKQSAPRVWISDGIITGIGDYSLDTVYEDYAVLLCEEAGIKRYFDEGEFISLFLKGYLKRKGGRYAQVRF